MFIVIAFFIGLFSSAFASLVGGAAGLFAVPLLLLTGLPPHVAVATPKMGAVGIALGSLEKFRKTNYIQWGLVPLFIVGAIAASFSGAQLLIKTPEGYLDKIVAGLLVFSSLMLFLNRDLGVARKATSSFRKGVGFLLFYLSESLRAAFGSGFGMLTGIAIMYGYGLTILESTATKRISGMVVSVVALITFLYQGLINIPVGIAIFFGTVIGSYVGTAYAVKLGDKVVKFLFVSFSLVMAVLLLMF